ncbi:MAG: hypothetical protein NC391_07540 [Alistipes timonensis]|nr:hypothetical protein [Alistipes timonensis]
MKAKKAAQKAAFAAEREGFFLRCAPKALRDNEPPGSHPSLSYEKSSHKGLLFLRKERDSFSATLRKRYAITNPRVLTPPFLTQKSSLGGLLFAAEREGFEPPEV